MKKKKATRFVTLNTVPLDLYESLKALADSEQRSLSKTIILLLRKQFPPASADGT